MNVSQAIDGSTAPCWDAQWRTSESAVLPALVEVLGVDQVLTGEQISAKYLKDWSNESGGVPMALVRPRSTKEVASVMKICHLYRQPVTPQGGLTGLAGGAVPCQGSVAMSLERMSGIVSLDCASATMTVLAGTPLQIIQEAADEAGFFFALDLGARGSCQIGGNVATNAGGNRVIRYGMMRDLVLGLEVVLPDGTILPMMNEMPKNNAGPDLKHLFIGSEGTLGVVTQVVLRLHPRVTGANTGLLALSDFDAVLKTLRYAQDALSGQVSAFEVMWPDFYQAVTDLSNAGLPLPANYPLYVLIDVQSADPRAHAERFESVLEYAMEQGWVIDAALAQSQADAQAFWSLRDAIGELLQRRAPTINFDLSVPISRIGECEQALRREIQTRFPEIPALFFGHVGDGNLHVVVGPLPVDGVSEFQIEEAFYGVVRDFSGSVSAEHGIGLHKKAWLSYSRSPQEMALIATLKNAIDPHGILNPGKIM